MSSKERNAPCECGSGLKYKKCCWDDDNTSKGMTSTAIQEAVKHAKYVIRKLFRDRGVDILSPEEIMKALEESGKEFDYE